METLSFTTFLKICLLPSTQSKTSELHRMHNGEGGYDFYKRMKLAAREVANGEIPPEQIISQLATIKRPSEREHNVKMAQCFHKWWSGKAATSTALNDRPSGLLDRPNMPFKIRLLPEICYEENGQKKVTYLWATARPRLTRQVAGCGILILHEALRKNEYSDYNFSILDLRTANLFEEDCVSNLTDVYLNSDIAQISEIWNHVSI